MDILLRKLEETENFDSQAESEYIEMAIKDLEKMQVEIAQLKDKLHRRNMQIKDLKGEREYLLDFVDSSDFLKLEFQNFKMERPFPIINNR